MFGEAQLGLCQMTTMAPGLGIALPSITSRLCMYCVLVCSLCVLKRLRVRPEGM